jgi:hypothetical protein
MDGKYVIILFLSIITVIIFVANSYMIFLNINVLYICDLSRYFSGSIVILIACMLSIINLCATITTTFTFTNCISELKKYIHIFSILVFLATLVWGFIGITWIKDSDCNEYVIYVARLTQISLFVNVLCSVFMILVVCVIIYYLLKKDQV